MVVFDSSMVIPRAAIRAQNKARIVADLGSPAPLLGSDFAGQNQVFDVAFVLFLSAALGAANR